MAQRTLDHSPLEPVLLAWKRRRSLPRRRSTVQTELKLAEREPMAKESKAMEKDHHAVLEGAESRLMEGAAVRMKNT